MAFPMLLSIKEMEVRKVPFAETFPPGAVDFSESGIEQSGDLRAEGVDTVQLRTDKPYIPPLQRFFKSRGRPRV